MVSRATPRIDDSATWGTRRGLSTLTQHLRLSDHESESVEAGWRRAGGVDTDTGICTLHTGSWMEMPDHYWYLLLPTAVTLQLSIRDAHGGILTVAATLCDGGEAAIVFCFLCFCLTVGTTAGNLEARVWGTWKLGSGEGWAHAHAYASSKLPSRVILHAWLAKLLLPAPIVRTSVGYSRAVTRGIRIRRSPPLFQVAFHLRLSRQIVTDPRTEAPK